MPKVGKVRLSVDKSQISPKNTVHDLWYTQTDLFHVKGIPPELIKLTGFNPRGYATESALEKALRECCDKFRELKKSQRKVIVFAIYGSAHLRMNKTGRGSYSGTRPHISKNVEGFGSQSPDAAIGLDFDVLMEVDDGGVKYYPINKDDEIDGHSHHVESEFRVIDWTAERQMFFESIYENMYGLLVKMSSFFPDDLEDTIKNIDTAGSNIKLLS